MTNPGERSGRGDDLTGHDRGRPRDMDALGPRGLALKARARRWLPFPHRSSTIPSASSVSTASATQLNVPSVVENESLPRARIVLNGLRHFQCLAFPELLACVADKIFVNQRGLKTNKNVSRIQGKTLRSQKANLELSAHLCSWTTQTHQTPPAGSHQRQTELLRPFCYQTFACSTRHLLQCMHFAATYAELYIS